MLVCKILAVVCTFYMAQALQCYSCDNCGDQQTTQIECSPQDDMCSIITHNGAVQKGCAAANGLCLKTNLENLGNIFNNLNDIDLNNIDFNSIDLNLLKGSNFDKLNTQAIDMNKINLEGVQIMDILKGVDMSSIDLSKLLQGDLQGLDISKLNLQGVDLNNLFQDVDISKVFQGVDLKTLDPQIRQALSGASKRARRSATSTDVKCCKDKDLCNGEGDIEQVTSTQATPTTNKAAHLILDTMALLMVTILLKLSYQSH